MQKISRRIIVIVLLCIFAGCIQTKEEYTLNPDGSGKVVYESTLPLIRMSNIMTDEVPDPQEQALEEVGKILKNSQGVDVWKDVNYKDTENGFLFFKGTAYFKKLSALRIGGSMKSEGDETVFETVFEKLPKGGMELKLVEKKAEKKESSVEELSDEELAKKVKAEKAKYQQSKGMLMAILSELRVEKIFHLPGQLNEVNVFKKDDDGNTVSILYEGDKMLQAYDELTKTDEWWRKQVLTGRGKEGPPMEDLHEKLFGVGGQARTTLKGELKPLFDYDAEVVAAKEAYPGLRKKLGLAKEPEMLPAAKGGSFKSLRIGGVRLVRESNQKNGVRPLNYDKGYTISVIGELPGSVLKVKDIQVLKAITDNGEDMRKKNFFHMFPQLSKDKGTVVFNINLRVPGDNVKSIKEVSGEIGYVVARGTKTVDLGTLKLKTGSKGLTLDAKISSIKESKWNKGSYELSLNLTTDKEYIKRVRFMDANGIDLEVEEAGYMQMNKNLTQTFRYDKEFPSEAHIIVEMYDKVQEYTIPYKLENISLLGLPMKQGKQFVDTHKKYKEQEYEKEVNPDDGGKKLAVGSGSTDEVVRSTPHHKRQEVDQKSHESMIIRMLKNYKGMNRNSRSKETIQNWINETEDVLDNSSITDLKIWNISSRHSEQKYLVSYIIVRGSNKQELSYEVDLITNTVRAVSVERRG